MTVEGAQRIPTCWVDADEKAGIPIDGNCLVEAKYKSSSARRDLDQGDPRSDAPTMSGNDGAELGLRAARPASWTSTVATWPRRTIARMSLLDQPRGGLPGVDPVGREGQGTDLWLEGCWQGGAVKVSCRESSMTGQPIRIDPGRGSLMRRRRCRR